jgi:hypothetical protein
LNDPNLVELVMTLKKDIIEVLCLTAECEEVLIRNQAQILFTYLLHKILQHQLPMREELEILIVKIALKPAINLAKRLGPQ